MPHREMPRRSLRTFLADKRTRIKPGEVGLPSHGQRRVPGLRREDVAELAGVSTRWYELFETGSTRKRFSFEFVGRVADALRLDRDERATLFRLALPDVAEELRTNSLSSRSSAALEAFRWLRGLSKRLWVATTEAEALTMVREHAMAQFKPDTMQSLTRSEQGRWDRAVIGASKRAQQYDERVLERWSGASIDDLCCYKFMRQPGDVITRSERDARLPDLAAKERPVLDAIALGDLSFVMASVRSKRGFVARLLMAHYADHDYSELERAQLSTLADVTSLALSG